MRSIVTKAFMIIEIVVVFSSYLWGQKIDLSNYLDEKVRLRLLQFYQVNNR